MLFGRRRTQGRGEADDADETAPAPLAEDAVRRHLLYEGQVQGVGFRWNVQRLAVRLHVTGWVRNLDDGTVEMEVQGSPDALARLRNDIVDTYRQFHMVPVISDVREMDLDASEREFQIRY
ncbi:MAG: acylphosphatase [Atopobiaceae bacterium]|jgi:acylphosphatase|nr:acylphosphatase [Atopobiaceae bacterium]MCI2172743.1 acylphosphatase [Atopobiaceae bacterium]MCI2207050.1 acylphosphatase [Atopobiaceae bacterium]